MQTAKELPAMYLYHGETIAQKWNRMASREIFADEVSDSGLPSKGRFAIPTMCLQGRDDNRRVRFSIGTFRVNSDGALDEFSSVTVMSERDWNFSRKTPERLMQEFIDSLPN